MNFRSSKEFLEFLNRNGPGRRRCAGRPRRGHCARYRHRGAARARLPGAPWRRGQRGDDQRDPTYPPGKVARTGARYANPSAVRRREARAAAAAAWVLISGGAPPTASAG
jgi:hypothetical protein